ncbi:LuxR family transcriptional regulator [Microvirga antarctica]|uniref:LuxR family transcriptional regulator n=1 Tax=Microvirga antarctica TaxID=2819233 RepID=UPI001B301F74|nr:LuxR family transcriptional regulator [Microvirga antarctica]
MGGESFSYANEAFAFVERLDHLTSPSAILDAMEVSLSRFGFQNFIVAGLPGPRERVDQVVLLKKWPPGWFDLYISEDFVRDDPIIRRCRNSVQPFAWIEAPFDREKEPRCLEVMNRASDFGMTHGFCLPIHGINGYEACISMSGTDLDLTAKTKPALHLMSVYAFERIRAQMSPERQSAGKPLTAREREMLAWAAAGKSAADTGDILGITERTVTAHIVSACHKLEATNKTQAVARALQYRLLNI